MLIIGLVIKLIMKRIDVMRGFVSVATEGSFSRVNKIQTDWMSADEPALKKRQKFSAYLLPKNEFNVKIEDQFTYQLCITTEDRGNE